MIWAKKGRKCWLVLEWWGRHVVAEGVIGGRGEGCLGWGICSNRECREVVIDHEGCRSIEYVCRKRELYSTRRAAQRAAKRKQRQWERIYP